MKGSHKIPKQVIVMLTHPMLLALVATVVVILAISFQWKPSKYKLELVDSDVNVGTSMYDDLDGNGYSDYIMAMNNANSSLGVSVRLFPHNYVEQWNFWGKLNFTGNQNLITGDYNNDGKKEIYSFSQSSDSIFINCILDFNDKKRMEQIFISRVFMRKGGYDPGIIPLQMDDLDDDGYQEVLFGITTGFSINPRNVFSFSPANGTILRSDKNASCLQKITQEDITGDGKNEFLLWNYAPCNTTLDTGYIYHDSSAWLMVLDRKLNFLFAPKEFKGKLQVAAPFVWHLSDSALVWGVVNGSPQSQIMLYSFNTIGNKILEKKIDFLEAGSFCQLLKESFNQDEPLVLVTKNKFLVVDKTFNLIRTIKFKGNLGACFTQDIDMDGKEEVIISTPNINKLLVYRHDLTKPATMDLKLDGLNTVCSLKHQHGNDQLLSLQSGNNIFFLSYDINPMFYWRWTIYAGIYFTILLFTLFVRRVQRVQIQRKYDTEKKITELQLKIVRNQLDPHFAFNAINSAIDAINNRRNDEAGQHLQQFSQMYRSLVLSSDKIKRTLKEELEFTENYMKMEQFRFNKKFIYSITIDPGIDTTIEVPKMIVQSYTENAIKHGLLCKKDGSGILEIQAQQIDNKLILTIIDNGRGRKEAAVTGTTSTGIGLEMMNNLYDLYYKITNRKITAEITDLYDHEGKPAGTSVKVVIPVN